MIAWLVVFLFFACSAAQAQPTETPTPNWSAGKNIYQRGHANQPACATCHGIAGEGGQEGGQRAPALKWDWLSAPQTIFGRTRAGYAAAEVARVLDSGLDVSGRQLSSLMPRYRLSEIELASLQNYLSIIGSAKDQSDGVADKTLFIGAALPLSGQLQSVGERIQRELVRVYGEVNAAGGLYGRQIQLVVRDTRSEPSAELAATQMLVEQDRVFLLAGSFLTSASGVETWLHNQALPLIGPVALASLQPEKVNNIFYVLPSMADQGRVLAEQLLARDEPKPACKKIAAWAEDQPYARHALQGAQRQLDAEGADVATAVIFNQATIASLIASSAGIKKSPDCVLFLGTAEDMALLAKSISTEVRWFALVALLGRGVSALPASLSRNLLVAQPLSGDAQAHEPFTLLARTAAQISIEALKRSGRDVNHATVIAALKALKDFRIEGLPPLSFSPQRRTALQGAAIMQWQAAEQDYTLVKAWREVR